MVIGAFFIISSISFSSRLDVDFGPKTWQTRWILLDGWLGILYFIAFCAIAWLWRPTANNRRLALSDEVPTEDTTAEDYEVDALTGDDSDKDHVPLRSVGKPLGNDSVVFDVGDDEGSSEDDEEADVGLTGSGRSRGGGSGENRPLRLPTSDDEEDAPPPVYKKTAKAD